MPFFPFLLLKIFSCFFVNFTSFIQSHSCPHSFFIFPWDLLPQNKIRCTKNRNLVMEAVVCHRVLHRIPWYPYNSTCSCSLQWVISLFLSLWFCYTNNTGSLPGFLSDACPVVVLWHGDTEALVLQDLPLHTMQQIIDGVGVGMGQLKSMDLGLRSS